MKLEDAKKIPKLYEAYLKQTQKDNSSKAKLAKNYSGDTVDLVKNKLGNKKITNVWGTFDSKLEYGHFLIFTEFSKKYSISFERQVSFNLLDPICVNDGLTAVNYKGIVYVTDFVLRNTDGGVFAIFDSKGFKTEKFILKHKMFANKYNQNIILLEKDTKPSEIEKYFRLLNQKKS